MRTKNYGFRSEAATDLKNIIKKFAVSRSHVGLRLELEWEFYDDESIEKFKILKKEGAYPLSVKDGIWVASGITSGTESDLNVENGTFYYYTMFVKLPRKPEFVFDILGMARALAVDGGYYQDALWNLIPGIYRHEDNKLA